MDYKPRKTRDLVAERAKRNQAVVALREARSREAEASQVKWKQSQAHSEALNKAKEAKQGYSDKLHTGSPQSYKLRHEMKKGLRPRPTKEQALEAFKNYSKD